MPKAEGLNAGPPDATLLPSLVQKTRSKPNSSNWKYYWGCHTAYCKPGSTLCTICGLKMCDRLGSTPPTLYKALMLKESNIKLLDAIKNIAKKGNFEINEKANYTAWSELGFLQSPNRDTRYFAFYNLFHCLKKDSNNVEMYLKLLKCRLIRSKC
ncbi:prolactin-like protein A [Rattus norvegicus]|uniref:Prolactin-like protein A n=1 Tax=Rattus norvegicus TaxID=10116 RepID=A6J7P8_RAT|nr:prolactin-like protein A [Rattus norvegicus]